MGAVLLGNLILSSHQDLYFARVGPRSPPACRSEQVWRTGHSWEKGNSPDTTEAQGRSEPGPLWGIEGLRSLFQFSCTSLLCWADTSSVTS